MTAKTLTTTCAALAVATLAIVGAADAHPRGGDRGAHHGAGFARLDADGDGAVSAEEFTDPAGARFAALDANGDGQVSPAEIAAHAETHRDRRREARAERLVERLDTDGNGSLSLEEMRRARDRRAIFERLDTDGDGSLTRDELEAGRETLRELRRGAGPHGG